jgi:hypothetical protein
MLLAACATPSWPPGSFVNVPAQDAATLAPVIADYLASTIPAGSAVALAAAQPGDPIAPLLTDDLLRAGLRPAPSGQAVQYVAVPMDAGVLLRVSIEHHDAASQFFVRADNGQLTVGGPLTEFTP